MKTMLRLGIAAGAVLGFLWAMLASEMRFTRLAPQASDDSEPPYAIIVETIEVPTTMSRLERRRYERYIRRLTVEGGLALGAASFGAMLLISNPLVQHFPGLHINWPWG